MSSGMVKTAGKIARPLKVLIPLIQQDLERGDRAGMEYYADAGDKLIEARESGQVSVWGAWVTRNFKIRERQASTYMRWARLRAEQAEARQNGSPAAAYRQINSLRQLEGSTERRRAQNHAERPLREALSDLDTDLFTQEKQTRSDEIGLHRDIAMELIDIGYKALAIRLHPDRGGSKDAMARLNRVREELRDVAKTRRFV